MSIQDEQEKFWRGDGWKSTPPEPVQEQDCAVATRGVLPGVLAPEPSQSAAEKASESWSDHVRRVEAERDAAIRERDEARANADELRGMVGECHLMVSRNTSQFQLRTEWESTTLPPRFQRVFQRSERAEAEAQALREQLEQERVRLAGCLVAAEGGTNDPAVQGQYGWSLAYQRTLDLRLAHEALRARCERALVKMRAAHLLASDATRDYSQQVAERCAEAEALLPESEVRE